MENEEKKNPDGEQKEQGPTFRHYQDIVDHAHKEVEWVRSAYKWLGSLLTIIIIAGLGLGLWFSYKSIRDFKDEIRSEVGRVRKQVESQIDEEFKKENIRLLVQKKAEERIDDIADQLIEQKIEENISPKIETTESKLKAVDVELTKANQKLTALSEFTLTLMAAQNDDRLAFNQLISWVNDKSFAYRRLAGDAIVKIRTYYGGALSPGYINVDWEQKNIDPSKLTLSDLRKTYAELPSAYHAYLVNYISKRTDIPRKDKMQFFIDVLKDEEEGSLTATHYAGGFFAKEANLKWSPFVIKPLLEWWVKSKDSIE
ncbi:MAG: hypothetical protein AMJ45_02040 [Syntrophobacter sp. DG_60]|nr:MAG: hypothetical protein AMJ45_02040 [Syntrophobacter sp. DG_60]